MGVFRNLYLPKHDSFHKVYLSTYINQKEFGKTIHNSFSQCHSVLALAPTQSGKTGTMIALIYEWLKDKNHSYEHAFVFTPHSSCEWLEQTKNRFPSFFQNQIFHRNQLEKLIIRLKNLDDVLLIIDECHIAAKIGQSLHSLYSSLQFYDADLLKKKNIRLVHFTATPGGLETHFTEFWKHRGCILRMNVPSSYLSFEKLIDDKRVLPAKDLCGFDKDDHSIHPSVFDNIAELRAFIDPDKPRYHIIRTPRGNLHRVVIDNFEKVFPRYTLLSEPDLSTDLNSLLSRPPSIHTFIFIKDKLRCAVTLNHSFLGVLYERFVRNPSHSVVTQSLAGRLTGYHNNRHAVVFSFILPFPLPSKQSYWCTQYSNSFAINSMLLQQLSL